MHILKGDININRTNSWFGEKKVRFLISSIASVQGSFFTIFVVNGTVKLSLFNFLSLIMMATSGILHRVLTNHL